VILRKFFKPLPLFCGYYFLIFMSGGCYSSYIPLYYSQIGLTSSQIGFIASLSAAVTLIAQPVWGLWGDRASTKNFVLKVSLFTTAASFWLLPLFKSPLWAFAAAVGIFTAFQCSNSPLADAIALEVSERERFSFSTVRTTGSVGFALVGFAAGIVFSGDSISRIFPLFSGLVFAAFLISFFLPKVAGHQKKGERRSFFAVLKDKKLTAFYLFTLIIQGAMGMLYTFQAVFAENRGYTTRHIGVGIMIGSFSQFPFMVFFKRISNKVPLPWLLFVSALCHAARLIIFAYFLNDYTFYFAWALHGMCYIVFYLCLADYVAKTAEPELRSSGQAMNALIISGVSRILGSAAGGMTAERFGMDAAFSGAGWICAAASVIFILFVSFRPAGEFKNK